MAWPCGFEGLACRSKADLDPGTALGSTIQKNEALASMGPWSLSKAATRVPSRD